MGTRTILKGDPCLPQGAEAMNNTEHLSLVPDETEYQLTSAANDLYPLDQKRIMIARRLRAARIAAHLTQQQLAEGLYSKSYLSAIERGKMTPSLQALTALAERLAVPVSYLLGESDVDLEALEESSALLNLPADHVHIADQAAAMLRLNHAEELLRQDQPHEALEVLGGSDEPPESFPSMQRPHWYRLAGWAAISLGKPTDAIRILEHGFHLAESLHLRASHSQRAHCAEQVEWLRCFLGIAHCANHQIDRALAYHLQGLEAVEKKIVANIYLKLMIYKGLGHDYLALGRYQEATRFYQLAVKHAQDQVDTRQHGLAAWGLGMVYKRHGDLLHAKESYLEALKALGAHGNLQNLAQIRALLGQVFASLKEYEEAESHLQYSLEGARKAGDLRLAGIALGTLATVSLARGEPEQAIQAAQEAILLAEQVSDQRSAGQLRYTLASAYAAMQNQEAAERAFQEAIRIAEQIADRDMLNQALQHYADFLAEHRRFQEAIALMQRAPSSSSGEQKSPEPSNAEESWVAEPLE